MRHAGIAVAAPAAGLLASQVATRRLPLPERRREDDNDDGDGFLARAVGSSSGRGAAADPRVRCEDRCRSSWLPEWWRGRSLSSSSRPTSAPRRDLVELFDQARPKVASIWAISPEALARLKAEGVKVNDSIGPEVFLPGEATFIGSGFEYGSDGFLATCAHLFENRNEEPVFAVRFGDGRWRLAELRGASAAADVAVLRLRAAAPSAAAAAGGAACAGLRLATGLPPKQGDWVAVCGSTQHTIETVGAVGVVTQPRQAFHGLAEEATVHFVQVALPTLPGMSGSPVLNSEGEVVAVLAKKFEEHGLALPMSLFAIVAKQLEDPGNGGWRVPVLGLDLGIGGCLADPKVTVRSVQQGCAAERAGVRAGYEILAVEGERVRSILDVREALLYRGGARGPATTSSGASTATVRLKLAKGPGDEEEVLVEAPLAAASPPVPSRSE